MPTVVTVLAAITIGLMVAVARHPELLRSLHGRALVGLTFGVLPLVVTGLAASAHLEAAKTTEFCVSCHVMEPYGASLRIDDRAYLPAVHFQDNLTPRDLACYTCHTSYTMFGGMQAKINGLIHVWKYYVGEVPETITLYEPYQNRECLHCHGDSRSFVEGDVHVDLLGELRANEISCLECHDLVHAVDALDGLDLWTPEPPTEGARNESRGARDE